MKKLVFAFVIISAMYACGGQDSPKNKEITTAENNDKGEPVYDLHRGEGKFKDVKVSPTLDPAMAEAGNKVYQVKCGACHKLSSEKLVGPGWKGVTERHSPSWVMNFITNTDEMISKDPEVQAQLEICLVRMPNQNLSDADARSLLEFMRKNDGVK